MRWTCVTPMRRLRDGVEPVRHQQRPGPLTLRGRLGSGFVRSIVVPEWCPLSNRGPRQKTHSCPEISGDLYKAGKVPWRLPPNEGDYKTSYLGIGFYKDLTGQRLLTSTAQMFDERGRGLILRGARA